MINFFHTNIPEAVLFSIGSLTVYKYGLLMVIGMIIGILLSVYIAKFYNINKDTIIDSSFLILLFGIIGARVYHVLLEFPYYSKYPVDIFKIWQGGLAIHGALIAGTISIIIFCKKNKINIWKFLSIFVPALSLAQGLGRWGNYFNQELYGLPTNLPWGIPIEPANRVIGFESFQYFQPTFIYESIGNFFIFLILIFLHFLIIKKNKLIKHEYIVAFYAISYSALRFSLEFIRTDYTPELLGLRFPQIASLTIIIFFIFYFLIKKLSHPSKNNLK